VDYREFPLSSGKSTKLVFLGGKFVKQRLVIVILFALVISAAASAILYRLISSQLAANRENNASQVLVAARNLGSGELIKEADVKIADWNGPAPPGALRKPEDAVGRGIVESIYQGEPIVETRIAARGAGAGLATIIPQGMRAVAVRVNDVVGVSGFATAGSHVDILIAGNPPGSSSAGTVTKTLLQNIEILSAGQNIQKDAEGKPVSVPVVNLLVTPEQAEILSLASNEARIQLVLRNPMDKGEAKTPGTAMAYLFSGSVMAAPEGPKSQVPQRQVRRPAPPPPPPPPPEAPKVVVPPPPITVEVYHGLRKSESKFKNEDEKAPEAAK
jgi:pilus assembly protein CpaB